jgi:hypothetical protein
LRWVAGAMLAASTFFYIIGTETMKGQAVLGAIGALIAFGVSFLLAHSHAE